MKTLSKHKNELVGLLGIFAVLGLIFFLNTRTVFGNAGYFAPGARSSTSTTSPTFMTVGTATTTVVYDAYGLAGTNQSPGQKSDTTDSVALLIQLTASTTQTTLGWRFEYSQDGQDWYGDNLITMTNASTTGVTATVLPNQFNWTFSSSTNLCDTSVTIATNNRGCKIVNVQTPTRFVRVIFYMSTTSPQGANGNVYGQFVGKKQQM